MQEGYNRYNKIDNTNNTKQSTNDKSQKTYKIHIDQRNNLIIERRMFQWPYLFLSIFTTFSMPSYYVLFQVNPAEDTPLFIVSLLITLLGAHTIINVIFNTHKINIGNKQLVSSVYPIPLFLSQRIPSDTIVDIITISYGRAEYGLQITSITGKKQKFVLYYYTLEEVYEIETLIKKHLKLEPKETKKNN